MDIINKLLQDDRATGQKITAICAKIEQMKYDFKLAGEKITQLRRDILALEKTEMYFAREWWKDKKYLVHVFPQDSDGNRQRVYIGNDPIAIREAQAKVARWHRHKKLCEQLQNAEFTLRELEASFGLVEIKLKRITKEEPKQPSFIGNVVSHQLEHV